MSCWQLTHKCFFWINTMISFLLLLEIPAYRLALSVSFFPPQQQWLFCRCDTVRFEIVTQTMRTEKKGGSAQFVTGNMPVCDFLLVSVRVWRGEGLPSNSGRFSPFCCFLFVLNVPLIRNSEDRGSCIITGIPITCLLNSAVAINQAGVVLCDFTSILAAVC